VEPISAEYTFGRQMEPLQWQPLILGQNSGWWVELLHHFPACQVLLLGRTRGSTWGHSAVVILLWTSCACVTHHGMIKGC
jgi:hypothetical protein